MTNTISGITADIARTGRRARTARRVAIGFAFS
jgi:hypothetical protein